MGKKKAETIFVPHSLFYLFKSVEYVNCICQCVKGELEQAAVQFSRRQEYPRCIVVDPKLAKIVFFLFCFCVGKGDCLPFSQSAF